MSSMCTGTGAAEICGQAVANAFSAVFCQDIDMVCPFMAENVKFKRDNLLNKIVKTGSDTCVFDDAVALSNGEGKCHRRQSTNSESTTCGMLSNYSRIQSPDGSKKLLYGFTAGFSCKGFSMANINYKKIKMLVWISGCPFAYFKRTRIVCAFPLPNLFGFQLIKLDSFGEPNATCFVASFRAASDFRLVRNALRDGTWKESSSVRTFQACLEAVESLSSKSRLDFFILENVVSMGDELDEGSNLAVAVQMLQECANGSFMIQPFRIDSHMYSLPQTRKRVYIVGLERSNRAFLDAESSMEAIATCLTLRLS